MYIAVITTMIVPKSGSWAWSGILCLLTGVFLTQLAWQGGEAISGTWREKMTQGRPRYGDGRVMTTFKHHNNSNQSAPNSHCSWEMFDGDPAAFWACRAQFSMQRNWFPDPLGGLYSYETWNGFDGFWQNGVILETFVNAAVYGNHSRYMSVIKNSFRELYDLKLAYGPLPSYDDLAWYGLSYTRIHEVSFRYERDRACNHYHWQLFGNIVQCVSCKFFAEKHHL